MLLSKKGIGYLSSEAHVAAWLNFNLERRMVNAAARKIAGGFWIGGKCELHEDRIIISPNALNAAVHENLKELIIPLDAVENMTLEKKLTTDIITLSFGGTEIKFRCFGAKNFLQEINDAKN